MAHPRLLDPKLDLVFKLLFAKPKNVELLISFLNSILTLPAHIKSLEVLNPELPKETVDDKGILLDVRVRFENDVEADIEMQSRALPGRRERALYYWARLFSGQLQRGDDFTELRRCIVVFVFDFIEFDGGDLHSVVSARDERRNQKLSDHLDLHFIQLPNLMNAQNQDDERLLRQWCKFLTASSEADLEELTMVDPIFQQAKAALEELSADPEVRRQATDREVALLLHRAEFAKGQEQAAAKARKEGREEGREEGRADLLLNQLKCKFGDVPDAVRERLKSASSEEISLWAERILFANALDEIFHSPPR